MGKRFNNAVAAVVLAATGLTVAGLTVSEGTASADCGEFSDVPGNEQPPLIEATNCLYGEQVYKVYCNGCGPWPGGWGYSCFEEGETKYFEKYLYYDIELVGAFGWC